MAAPFNNRNGDVDFPTFTSPLRGLASNSMTSQAPNGRPSNDARASLTRRFTTNAVPTVPTLSTFGSPLSPIGQARRQAVESAELNTASFHKVQLLEKKKLEYEFLKEQRRRFQTEMELLELQARNQENEMLRLSGEVNRMGLNSHQTVPKSEPTTPPEYRENGFSSTFGRTNRYSTSSMQALQSVQSPPFQTALAAHPNRHSTQIPPTRGHSQTISHMPSKSVPGSRRNSDEEEDDEFDYTVATMNPRTTGLNRNSMPVTGYDLRALNDSPAFQHDTTSFLFSDEEESQLSRPRNVALSAEGRSFFRTVPEKDNFPVLVRGREDAFAQLSSGLDLAPQSPGPDVPNAWSGFSHRQNQKSLNNIRGFNQADEYDVAANGKSGAETPTKSAFASGNRRSMEVKFGPLAENKRPGLLSSPSGMPRLQSSYSTNDIPTLKSTNAFGSPSAGNGNGNINAPKLHAGQHLHNHNASLGRIPAGAVSNRHSRELSGGVARMEEQPKQIIRPLQSALQASAAPFGPAMTTTPSMAANSTISTASTISTTSSIPAYPGASAQTSQYSTPAYYQGYGFINGGVTQQPQQLGAQNPYYPGQGPYATYGQFYQPMGPGRLTNDTQARMQHQRRMGPGDENSRYSTLNFDEVEGQILDLCKDQHGCRYLQKRLEEHDPTTIEKIFNETKDHVVELMTDPFGNYLCQKLLEFTNDEQRTALINNAAPSMVKIAFNQHGTRALQKMIEFISTPEQIQTIIHALEGQVVELIQDLNGNHVIQKCLNHLTTDDAQFIFTAVAKFAVVVGTHRHGCCVLQRCIDHASPTQKAQLVHSITECAFPLVQDPFGNYVVQYILDLNEPSFIKPLCVKFSGHVAGLSKQKFSSNVIEKCIRVADAEDKYRLIEEMLNPVEIEKMLRDGFANYVVQTAMDYADPELRNRLIDAITPHLAAIRNTPYGRRILSKIQDHGGRLPPSSSGAATPQDMMSPVSGHSQVFSHHHNIPASFGSPTATQGGYSMNGYGHTNIASPQPHRLSNPPLPAHLQASVNGNYHSINGRLNQFF